MNFPKLSLVTLLTCSSVSKGSIRKERKCAFIKGEWISREYSSFRLSDVSTMIGSSYILEEGQTFTLNVTEQYGCYFRAIMSNKPKQYIAGYLASDGTTSMLHIGDSQHGYVHGYLDENDVLTFTFQTGYYAAETFETQLTRGSVPDVIPCPDVSDNLAWATASPYHSILAYDNGRIRMTWDQNMTFNFHNKSGCVFYAFNDWKSEREGGPYHQEIVGVVSSRLSVKGEIQMYAAQFGTFGTYSMPLTIKSDGSLNYMGLTPHTGGPLYDYFGHNRTEEFFDSLYLNSLLESKKVVQGIDLVAEFTDPFPDKDEMKTGIDMWQVLMAPAPTHLRLDNSEPALTYGFDGLSFMFGAATKVEINLMKDNCETAKSIIGMTEWVSPDPFDAAAIFPNGTFKTYTSNSKLEIQYWGKSTAPNEPCYFAGLHKYANESGENIVAAVVGMAEVLGGVPGINEPLRMQMTQSGPCKASILANVLNDEMNLTYTCSRTHWEDVTRYSEQNGEIFSALLRRPAQESTSKRTISHSPADVSSAAVVGNNETIALFFITVGLLRSFFN